MDGQIALGGNFTINCDAGEKIDFINYDENKDKYEEGDDEYIPR